MIAARIRFALAGALLTSCAGSQPALHSPPQRAMLCFDSLHLPRSLRRAARQSPYRLTLDHAFARVIRACAEVPRPGQEGTWITSPMLEAYVRLHEIGATKHFREAEKFLRHLGIAFGHRSRIVGARPRDPEAEMGEFQQTGVFFGRKRNLHAANTGGIAPRRARAECAGVVGWHRNARLAALKLGA